MTTFLCSFRSCRCNTIDPALDTHVRIRLDIHNGTTKVKNRDQWPVQVDNKTGVASLHQTCWDLVSGEHLRGRSKLARLLQSAADTAEYFESHEQVKTKAAALAKMLRESRHAVAFTGAGISTAAGIGDFRGLFGQWTHQDMTIPEHVSEEEDEVPYEDLRPTLAHEALQWLMQNDMLKYVITQNCDGLHRLSGIPVTNISELHGNIFIEYCRQCGREFERNSDVCNDAASLYYEELEEQGFTFHRKPKAVQCLQCKLTHQTGRKCPTCKKPLHDTIINFGDDLRDSELAPAEKESQKADLVFVLGSTLMVTPAANLCTMKRRQRLVICNRQETAHDERATLRVNCDCDVLMIYLLKELMGEASFNEWLAGREERLQSYDKLRRG